MATFSIPLLTRTWPCQATSSPPVRVSRCRVLSHGTERRVASCQPSGAKLSSRVRVNELRGYGFGAKASATSAQLPRRRQLSVQCTADEGFSKGAQEAAEYLVDAYVRDKMIIGVGASGPAARAAIAYIKKKLEKGYLKGVKAVPMSLTAATELAFHGIPVCTLEDYPEIDFAFDYADEVDEFDPSFPLIKGRPASQSPVQVNILAERKVVEASKMFVGIMGKDGVKASLGGTLPVMVDGDYWEDIGEELDDIFIGEATIWRRSVQGESAEPHGGDAPFITTDGQNILDIRFDADIINNESIQSYRQVEEWIEAVPGVVAHGLYLNTAYAVIVVSEDGFRTLSPFKTEISPIAMDALEASASVDDGV